MVTVVLDLVERVTPAVVGSTVEVPIRPGQAELAAQWCARTGNELVSVDGEVAVVRRGPLRWLAEPDPPAGAERPCG